MYYLGIFAWFSTFFSKKKSCINSACNWMSVLVYTGDSLQFKNCIEMSVLPGTDLCKDMYFSSHRPTQESGTSCSATMCSPFQHRQPEGLENRRGQLHLHTSFSRKLSEITGWKDEINWSCPECAVKVIKHRKEVGWQNTWTPEWNSPPGPVCRTWETCGSHCQTVF